MPPRSAAKSDLPLSFTFLNASDPDKYIKYWASGMHRVINRILRKNLSADDLAERYPSGAYFVQQTFRLFYDAAYPHAIAHDSLLSECKTLYRGLRVTPEMLGTDGVLRDAGFVSFSKTQVVAADFTRSRAGEVTAQPMMLQLPVKKLNANARFLSINKTVDPAFNEDEILLLPGKFVLSDDIKGTENRKVLSYEPDAAFVDRLVAMDLPVPEPTPDDAATSDGGGALGAPAPFRRSAVLPSKIAPESLGGTYLVYYRAIQGRPAEVLTWRVLPMNATELVRNVRYYVPNRCDSHVYEVLPYIPEYRDLEARYKKGSADGPDKLPKAVCERLSQRMASYEMQAAVYDPIAKRVLTMNLTMPNAFFRELYPDLYKNRLQEAHDAILAHFAELGNKAPGFAPTT